MSLTSTIIAADKTSDISPYLRQTLAKARPEAADTIKTLTGLAEILITLGKGALLLSEWDSAFPNGEFLPLREALNAAAHNDVSLLELLAPEVKEPARQFLAVIAPKLLQQSGA